MPLHIGIEIGSQAPLDPWFELDADGFVLETKFARLDWPEETMSLVEFLGAASASFAFSAEFGFEPKSAVKLKVWSESFDRVICVEFRADSEVEEAVVESKVE